MRSAATRSLAGIAVGILCAVSVEAQGSETIRYRFDAARSTLRWEVPATLHTVRGVAPRFEGSVEADRLPEGGHNVRARIVVEAASLNTGNQRRDRTMREKVLETDRYAEIVFELTRFTGDLSSFRPGQHFTVQIEGALTVHGRRRPILLPVDVYVMNDHVMVTGSFPVHWKSYDLADPSTALMKVKEPLQVVFRLRAVPDER